MNIDNDDENKEDNKWKQRSTATGTKQYGGGNWKKDDDEDDNNENKDNDADDDDDSTSSFYSPSSPGSFGTISSSPADDWRSSRPI